MVVQHQEEMGEGSANPTDPHHTPTIIQPSTSQPQKKQKPRRPKRKDTEIPQSSGPTDNVADEAVNKEMDDSLERAATTATSLDAEQDRGNINKTQSKATPNEPSSLGTSSGGGPRRQETMGDTIAQTRSENVSKHSNDPLLARGNTLQSGEDRLKLEELMEFCTKLQQRVLDLGNTKTTQAQEITSLKLRVKKLERRGGSRTHRLKRLYKGRKIDDIDKDAEITLIDKTQRRYGDDQMFDTGVLDDEEVFAGQDIDEKEINVAEKEVSTADLVTTAGEVVTTASPTETTTADDLTLSHNLIEIGSAKSKVKGVVIGEQSKTTTRTRPQQLQSKDKEEHEKLSIEEKSKLFIQLLEARKKHFVAIRAKEKRNKPPSKAQKRNTMSTYLKNIAGYKHNQLKNKSFDDIQKLFDKAMKRVNTFVDIDTELVKVSEVRAEAKIAQESSSKRAGTELEQESIKKQKGRIVGIKRLHDDLEVTAAKVCVTAAKLNTASVKLVLLVKIEENILSSYYCLYTVNAAGV
ncbi:hypothetical protein Tco_0257001 [Tanacetum coccineum]